MENRNNGNILIVDDIPRNIQVLGNILKENHYQVEFALDGPSALKWVEKKNFDLILLDIMMPGMTGFEVCKQLRKNKEHNDIPIIFLTAKTDRESIVEGFKLGGKDYITKPFDSTELLARVHTHVELKKARDVLENMNAVLEKKVEERTSQLSIAHQKLQSLDEAKTTFLNIISHEIRTPLNGILGSVNLIKEYGLNDETEEFLTMLDASALRLEKFSYHTLDISIFSADQKNVLTFEPVHLKDLMQLSIDQHRKEINNKNISVVYNTSSCTRIELDSHYIKKVNDLLLENAIKFTLPNSEIAIKVDCEDNFMNIYIKDQGEGFKNNISIETIVPFSNKNHIDENPGLSLYLCRLIVEAHGGKIWNGNNKDTGAYVAYKLPIRNS